MNELVFVLVLLGIRAYLRGHDWRAAASIVAATAIKITPDLLRRLARHPRPPPCGAGRSGRGARLRAGTVAVQGTGDRGGRARGVLPRVSRGTPARGGGQYTAGQNVAGLVNRMMRPGTYRYLPASEDVAQHVYQALWVGVLLVFLSKLVLLRLRRAPPSAFEFSMAFLAALLLSPITFTTHLVSLLFVYATFLSVLPPHYRSGGGWRWPRWSSRWRLPACAAGIWRAIRRTCRLPVTACTPGRCWGCLARR